jgi:hypothetical protein
LKLGGSAGVLRVVGQTRVGDVGYPRVLGEDDGDGEGVVAVTLQPQRHGDGSAHDQPGVERCDGTADVVHRSGLDAVDQAAGADDGASHRIAVTVDVLRQRVNGEVCAEFEWPQQRRRGEGRVDRQARPTGVGDLGERGDLGDAEIGALETIAWSPGLSRVKKAACRAAMPVAKTAAASPCSSMASFV